ncbi:terminase family protein [Phyllobacterium sp. SB3]|uniref:terminase large subunit domain-containing protein n=1 Tax=Phyllobacterium sp. SB3 TaxID=3156073 RepID=UPI0032AF88D7
MSNLEQEDFEDDEGEVTEIDLGYVPRDQFLTFHSRTKRWGCILAHRRAGKSVACIADLVDYALANTRDYPAPRYGYIAPTFAQAKDTAWGYLKEFASKIPGTEIRESDLSCIFPNKSVVRLYGSDNYDRMRGIYFDGVIIDEAGDIDPRAWPEVIRPALADRQGWATFIGTPKGMNFFYDIYQQAKNQPDQWFSITLKASETGILSAGELHDAKQMMTPEQYEQEFECSFSAAIKGSYYGSLIEAADAEGRITKVAYDKAVPVYTSWDLGINDTTAIWVFQLIGNERHYINYYENANQELSHYVDWIKSLSYSIEMNYLPHDADARELQSGKSRTQFLRGHGLTCLALEKSKSVIGDIELVRTMLNRCWFDKDLCQRGLECLKMYQSQYNERMQVLSNKPLHNWASNGADSFRYSVVSNVEARAKRTSFWDNLGKTKSKYVSGLV